MATPDQIEQLRILIGESEDIDPWTDEFLGKLIDTAVTVDKAAQTFWRGKAAQSAHLVDISEGGSSRKMSDVHKNYLAMASTFADPADEIPVATARPSRTRGIKRA